MSTAVENPLALAVVVEGKVLSSNLPEFREAVKKYVGEINRDLVTDDQFVQAQQDVKNLQSMEDAIKAAKEKALRDAEQLHTLFSQLDQIGEIPREARLSLSKLIESKKESIKAQMVADALNKIICAPHLRLKTFKSVVESSIKGKRTLESMEKALDVIVGSLNESITAAKAVIAEWEKANDETVPDADTLMLEPAESVRLKLQARTQARIEAKEKKRLADEAENERQARLKAEAEVKAAQEAAAPPAPAPSPVPSPSVNATPPAPPATTTPPAASAPEEETEAEELARICALVRAQLVSLKPIMDGAKHANNILRIRAFRAAVNPAFAEMQKGGEA
jgi:hypothetical protein